MNLAGEYGLSLTPSFLINEEVVIGPPPTGYLSEIISQLLADE
jgi:protein-disulfide isomerase